MAIVYRGHDTSLNREVAIKVLHHHLAEHKEARERFGREAHAVAKLHHQNILEIHDFSGLESEESYIVTEFIDGCTLSEFMVEHSIRFPEIGAMITVQVCRALAHAHGLGVLHRDVKPENVMIRNDGVVKLTDFGIAQMIDVQRMTVTGQLLGSPAYMSPEHVKGGELDFRTDVFAVGIMLFQLVTGELPFNGKNPHEILKRIAECQYPDPRRLCAQVGNELAGIINKALAASPSDRYDEVGLMQEALEAHITGSGIGDLRSELEQFFNDPESYQVELEPRLIAHLSERGNQLLDTNRVAALELFNRVLSIDDGNAHVLNQIRRIGARQRHLRLAGLVVLALGVLALAVLGVRNLAIDEPDALATTTLATDAGPATMTAMDARTELAGISDAQREVFSADASAAPQSVLDASVSLGNGGRRRRRDAAMPDATPAPHKRKFQLSLTPRGSEYRVGKGPWTQASNGSATVTVPPGDHVLFARNPTCCQEESRVIEAGDEGGDRLQMNLRWLPATVTPTCNIPGVRAQINGKGVRLNRPATIIIERITGTEVVRVEFVSDDGVDEQSVTVRAKQTPEVKCQF